MHLVKLYYYYIGLQFKSNLEYKSSFLVNVGTTFYSSIIRYITLLVIISKFDYLLNWTKLEIVLLYSINLFSSSIAGMILWTGPLVFSDRVMTGEYDLDLIKPVNPIILRICMGFSMPTLGQFIVSSIIFVCSILILKPITFIKIGYIFIVLGGGVLFNLSAFIFIMGIVFWIPKSRAINNLITVTFREFINYPLSIYPSWLKHLLTFIIPWGFVNYYPLVIILGKSNNQFDIIMALLTPVICLFICYVSIAFYNYGLKRYTSAGC